jgi:DNA invertase Pin-like site-specific DNA recombinase
MTVAAPTSRSFYWVAPSGQLTLIWILATTIWTAFDLPSLILESCLTLWAYLALFSVQVTTCRKLACFFFRRVCFALRLGASTAVLAMKAAPSNNIRLATTRDQPQTAVPLLSTQVSIPAPTDVARDWDEVMGKPLYPEDRPLRAAIYRRVSTLEQEEEGHSLDEQLVRAKRCIENNGWVLVEVFTDVYSGKSGKRKALRRLEKAVLAGEVDVVIIDRIDRLYRNLQGLLRIVKLFTEQGVNLVSVSEQIGFDTPWGRLVLTVLGALAEYYLDSLSAETSKGKRARARLGLVNGAFRFGVCNGLCSECSDPNGEGYCPHYGGENRGNGRIPIHHPVESQAVALMYRWYATGKMSYEDIAHRLNARRCTLPSGEQVPYRTKGRPGLSEPGPFTADAIRYMIRNPFYKGYVGYGGTKANGQKERKPVELFEGQHQPLVGEQTWNRCQVLRKQRRHRPHTNSSPARIYPLSRLLFCQRCKSSMRGFSSNGGRHRYYGDHLFREKWRGERKTGLVDEELEANLGLAYNHQPNVRAEDTEGQVKAVVGQILLPADWKRLILAYISEEGGLSAFHRKKLEVRERLQRANERYLSSVTPISRWDLERIERECLVELEQLDKMLPPGVEEPDVWQYLDDFGRLWEDATSVRPSLSGTSR